MPLTVSPFVSLPSATTLPYQYQSLPSSLPPSSIADQSGGPSPEKSKFVVSSNGYTAHPDDIVASCQKLQCHLKELCEDAKKNLNDWEKSIQERELAEKRRVAPGWLDRRERILQPETLRTVTSPQSAKGSRQDPRTVAAPSDNDDDNVRNREAEELDRAFGSMNMR